MSVLEDLMLRFTTSGFREGREEIDATAGAIRKTDKHAKEASKSTVGLGKSFGGLKGMAANAAGMVGIGGLAFGLADAVRHAQHLQDVQTQLGASIHANVRQPARDATEQMSQFADSMSTKGGFTPTESIAGMTQFLRVTKSVSKAEGDATLASNIARGAHVDYGRAIRAVTMLEQGRTTGLSKLGITVPKITTAYDNLKATTKNATVEQVNAAKATDALATKQAGMATVSKQYGGAMATYSKTSSGGISNLRNSVEVLSTKLGTVLLPAVNWVVKAFVSMVGPLGKMLGYLKPMLPLLGALAGAWALYKVQVALSAAASAIMNAGLIANTIEATSQMGVMGGLTAAWAELDAAMDANPIMLVVLAIGVLVVALVVAYKHVKWFRDAVNAAWSWMKTAAKDTAQWVVNAFHNVVHFFGVTVPHVFDACVNAITSAWASVVDFFRKLPGRIGSALSTVGKIMASPFVAAYNFIHKQIEAVWKDVKWLVDQIVHFFTSLPGRIVRGLGNIGSTIGHVFKGALSHLPLVGGVIGHLATGGPVTQTGPYLVGERGPEIVTLPRGGYVTPNGGGGGGGDGQAIVIYNILDGKLMSQSVIRQGLLQQSRGG